MQSWPTRGTHPALGVLKCDSQSYKYDVRIVLYFFKSGISECSLNGIKLIKRNSVSYNCTENNLKNNNNKPQQEKLN